MVINQQPRGGLVMAEAVRQLYAEGQTDYSMEPIVLENSQGKPLGRIQPGDAVIFCCRRGEREIQLTEAFTEPETGGFNRRTLKDLVFVILTLYHEKFKNLPVAFAPTHVQATLAETVSRAGLRQLRVSESEKFAHVTFFFNGGNNQPLIGEEDVRIPSPKGIPFDQVPELSLPEVTNQVLEGIRKGYDLIVTNFANGDVIGHTNNDTAKVECARLVDARLGEVLRAAESANYVTFVTADHGNLEEMINPDGSPHVSHTANPVPFIFIDPQSTTQEAMPTGKLADIAPTILHALDVPKPIEMTGCDLLPGHKYGGKRRVLLVILDGWGTGREDDGNPIHIAKTPIFDNLLQNYSSTRLEAAGEAVGLKAGKAGNSEAGHINIGTGRVILQDDVRLDRAMQDGSFSTNEILCQTINTVKKRGTQLHLIGLLTEKSSHGSIDYPLALLKMAKEQGVNTVFLHIIFDGRSTAPGSAPALLEKLDSMIMDIGIGQIVTGVGRGIALDRDGNYEKTQRTYDALVDGTAKRQTIKLS